MKKMLYEMLFWTLVSAEAARFLSWLLGEREIRELRRRTRAVQARTQEIQARTSELLRLEAQERDAGARVDAVWRRTEDLDEAHVLTNTVRLTGSGRDITMGVSDLEQILREAGYELVEDSESTAS